jgi:two-component system, sensor histidine kinase and response regulator
MNTTTRNPIILIVDDNPRNLQLIALTLREFDYKLIFADGGQKAIELSDRYQVDMILLDVMMPGIDGFEVCRIIRSNPKNDGIPIIFITALSEKSNLVKGFELGAEDYITKPFNKEELIIRIKTHLDMKFARDDLQRVKNSLSESNTIKDKIFSVIGHDLRSPIGSIKMMLELLLGDIDSFNTQNIKEIISSLSKTTDEVFNLLENLLWWARSQNGNLSNNPESFQLSSLTSSLYFLNKESLSIKKIRFEDKIDQECMVYADMNMLKTVLRNLISNAIKFTPKGGSVTLSATGTGDFIKIMVSDTGVGISVENLSKLFDENQKISFLGTEKESGSGLGLILCKNFVQANNGRICAESIQNHGSTFSIEIPKGGMEQTIK